MYSVYDKDTVSCNVKGMVSQLQPGLAIAATNEERHEFRPRREWSAATRFIATTNEERHEFRPRRNVSCNVKGMVSQLQPGL